MVNSKNPRPAPPQGAAAPFDFAAVQAILRCPGSVGELVAIEAALVCCDADCRLQFPIVDGFPVMLVEEALSLEPGDWGKVMALGGRDPVTGEVVESDESNQ